METYILTDNANGITNVIILTEDQVRLMNWLFEEELLSKYDLKFDRVFDMIKTI